MDSNLSLVFLSDPSINKDYFATVKRLPILMELGNGQGIVELSSWKQSFSVTQDRFYIRNVAHRKVGELFTKEQFETGGQLVTDRLNDLLIDLNFKENLKGLALNNDASKDKYLSKGPYTESEYHIFGNEVFLRSVQAYELKGPTCQDAFKNIDLTKFMFRCYRRENLDPRTKNLSDQQVELFQFDSGRLFIEHRIDHVLLRQWLIFQLMKQVLPVRFDPFFERDGLLHMKTSGYRKLYPEYDIPNQLIQIDRTVQNLQVSREYCDENI